MIQRKLFDVKVTALIKTCRFPMLINLVTVARSIGISYSFSCIRKELSKPSNAPALQGVRPRKVERPVGRSWLSTPVSVSLVTHGVSPVTCIASPVNWKPKPVSRNLWQFRAGQMLLIICRMLKDLKDFSISFSIDRYKCCSDDLQFT